jgi:hypothetical protein
VENLQPFSGSNFLTALISPSEPSWIRSWMLSPWFAYFLAIETTSLRFAVTIVFLAC